jgi:hypothetical protein
MVRAANGRRWGHRMAAWTLGFALAAPLVQRLELSPAHAAPPRPGAAASTRAKAKATPPSARARARAATPAAAAPAPAPATAPAPVPVSAPASGAAPAVDVVRTEERAGEKTYTFGAQEVEGRLKSPQILYFLRRVRAQFDPAPLGHRSFFLELSDTRRHPALE